MFILVFFYITKIYYMYKSDFMYYVYFIVKLVVRRSILGFVVFYYLDDSFVL